MNSFVDNYTFTFNKETDSLQHITSNFNVINSYEFSEEKKIKTDWSSSSPNVVFTPNGEAIVTRSKSQQKITLTETQCC